jgi:hypothetical protein
VITRYPVRMEARSREFDRMFFARSLPLRTLRAYAIRSALREERARRRLQVGKAFYWRGVRIRLTSLHAKTVGVKSLPPFLALRRLPSDFRERLRAWNAALVSTDVASEASKENATE